MIINIDSWVNLPYCLKVNTLVRKNAFKIACKCFFRKWNRKWSIKNILTHETNNKSFLRHLKNKRWTNGGKKSSVNLHNKKNSKEKVTFKNNISISKILLPFLESKFDKLILKRSIISIELFFFLHIRLIVILWIRFICVRI